jgi:hypothetical protein
MEPSYTNKPDSILLFGNRVFWFRDWCTKFRNHREQSDYTNGSKDGKRNESINDKVVAHLR